MDQQLQQISSILAPLVEKLGGVITITKAEFAALGLVKTTVFFEEQTNGDVIVELAKGETAIQEARKRHQANTEARSDLIVP